MLPSEWLADISATYLYRESKLETLRACDITYVDGQMTSHMTIGNPYLTFGRIASVRLLTPREAVSSYGARLKPAEQGPLILGCDIGAALWDLLHDITDTGPPSKWVDDLNEKLQLDIADIRRYGY